MAILISAESRIALALEPPDASASQPLTLAAVQVSLRASAEPNACLAPLPTLFLQDSSPSPAAGRLMLAYLIVRRGRYSSQGVF